MTSPCAGRVAKLQTPVECVTENFVTLFWISTCTDTSPSYLKLTMKENSNTIPAVFPDDENMYN